MCVCEGTRGGQIAAGLSSERAAPRPRCTFHVAAAVAVVPDTSAPRSESIAADVDSPSPPQRLAAAAAMLPTTQSLPPQPRQLLSQVY